MTSPNISASQGASGAAERNGKAAIRTEHLVRHYPMGDALVRAVDDVTMSVAAGEFVALLGSSGSENPRCSI